MKTTDPAILLCYGCRKTGKCRLGLGGERLVEPGVTRSELTCPPEYEGGPGVAHGGWTAEAMDEALGRLNLLSGQMTVTAELTVTYRRPVPVGRPLELHARYEKIENGRRWIVGELLLASTGAILARARGIFVERDSSHFDRFNDWIASQDAASGRDTT
ncbi:MAG: PaaI family thioesterase [Rhizomicrobium sp.]